MSLVNAELVPVWIDVRTTSLPASPGLDTCLGRAAVDPGRRVTDRFSTFFVRSAVLTPDGATLLNEEPDDAPFSTLLSEGHFPYARVKAEDYLPMLERALAAHRRRAP